MFLNIFPYPVSFQEDRLHLASIFDRFHKHVLSVKKYNENKPGRALMARQEIKLTLLLLGVWT